MDVGLQAANCGASAFGVTLLVNVGRMNEAFILEVAFLPITEIDIIVTDLSFTFFLTQEECVGILYRGYSKIRLK